MNGTLRISTGLNWGYYDLRKLGRRPGVSEVKRLRFALVGLGKVGGSSKRIAVLTKPLSLVPT